MSFFESEVVRAELVEIQELQEEVYSTIFKFPSLSKEEKIEHVADLERLLDKQKIMYTRLSLSDDPQAKEMKESIANSALALGLPANVDMNVVFNNMSHLLENMRKMIDKDQFQL
jgi:hypothetical protein|tara:strand:+ start:385 stop:729 length:345 start_codon:yes stop_codon:yes gene_type:complete